jgi:signal peptidase I
MLESLQSIRIRAAGEQPAQWATAEEVLHIPGAVSLRVASCSMLPVLWPGDVIAVRRVEDRDITPGKLVVYLAKDFLVRQTVRWDPAAESMTNGVVVTMFTVHRAVRWERGALITRGDAIPVDDSPVQPASILGEVVAIQRRRARLVPKEQLTGAQKLFCFFLHRVPRLPILVMRLYSLHRALTHSLTARGKSPRRAGPPA